MKIKNISVSNNKISAKDFVLPVKLFGILLGIFSFIFFYPNNSGEFDRVTFEIPRGSSFNRVADYLLDAKIIPNKFNFKIAAFLYGVENKLKAGRYNIPNNLTYFELLQHLIEGGHDIQKLVTIPEGIWQHNLASLLQKELNVDSSEFMNLSKDKLFLAKLGVETKTIEGYLLPETYYFYTNSTAVEIIEKLYDENSKLFDEKAEERMKELKMTRNQILSLASIIEAESNIASEFARISGVYHNRLKKWMKLEADPTIQYLKRNGKHNRVLLKDLEINSPYNTYMNYGLPPTPINNPGKDAIIAALFPEQNNYYYFVADGTGAHLYAQNYSEHLANVKKYREWRDTQR